MKMIKRCKSASIYDRNKNLLCNVNVYLDDEENLMLSVPKSFDPEFQETYDIMFFDPVLGITPCVCELTQIEPVSEDMDSYSCNVLQKNEPIQRREDLKVPVNITIKMFVLDQPIGGIIDLDNPVKAVMKDISAGGVFVITDEPIEAGKYIRFRFSGGRMPVLLTAKILRVMDLTGKNEKYKFGYGCQFCNLTKNDEMQVRSYVYKVEKRLYG